MSKPQRIQRKRTKGWRMPENCVYVGRPTRWGNPFTGNGAVARFREHVAHDHEEIKRELRGKDLACWCNLEKSCHADVLLEIANES